MKGITYTSLVILTGITLMLIACRPNNSSSGRNNQQANIHALADTMEQSLLQYTINIWYPLNIDSAHGGFTSAYNYDWSIARGSQSKALVQQARHLWSTAFIYESYPDRKEFIDYAEHGFSYLRDVLWDSVFGGYFYACDEDGSPLSEYINDKRIYGQSFALYGLSQYYRLSKNEAALDLARKTFLWMEAHAHDHDFGGYYEFLTREGAPVIIDSNADTSDPFPSQGIGLKDFNSSIHIMESLTELYKIWPDQLVRKRLEEMFYLIRDTFIHEDGYLQCFFYPDWTLVPVDIMDELSGGVFNFTQHFTFGHDVETAFLLLETAHELELDTDETTHRIAKKLVDHSLAEGWDHKNGGFYEAGRDKEGSTLITGPEKSWWTQAEGMNALLLMHTLYPDDTIDYYSKFLQQWNYIDTYLIDKEYGAWYNYGLDNSPQNRQQKKSHHWKTTYHNLRGMTHCIRMLREMTH